MDESYDVSDIDSDIEQWTQILEKAQARTPQTELQLVRFLLVHMCGRYERVVDNLIKERAKKSGDRPLASYVVDAYKMRREPSCQYLQNDVLGKFGDKQRECFKSKVNETTKTNYDSLITNRNNSAHGKSFNASLDDITAWHQDAKKVLREFEKALNLPDDTSAQSTAFGREQARSETKRGGSNELEKRE